MREGSCSCINPFTDSYKQMRGHNRNIMCIIEKSFQVGKFVLYR